MSRSRVLLSATNTDRGGGLLSLDPVPHRIALVDAVVAAHPRADLVERCAIMDGHPVTVASVRWGAYGPAIVAEDATLRHGGAIIEPAGGPRARYLARRRILDVAAGHRADALLRDALRSTVDAQPPLTQDDLTSVADGRAECLLLYGSLAPDLGTAPAHLGAVHAYDHSRDMALALCRPPDRAPGPTRTVELFGLALLGADVGRVPLRAPLPPVTAAWLDELSDSDLRAWLGAVAAGEIPAGAR